MPQCHMPHLPSGRDTAWAVYSAADPSKRQRQRFQGLGHTPLKLAARYRTVEHKTCELDNARSRPRLG